MKNNSKITEKNRSVRNVVHSSDDDDDDDDDGGGETYGGVLVVMTMSTGEPRAK